MLAMPKRKAPELTPAEQKKRFEELAREVGARQRPAPDDLKKALRQVTFARSHKDQKPPK